MRKIILTITGDSPADEAKAAAHLTNTLRDLSNRSGLFPHPDDTDFNPDMINVSICEEMSDGAKKV